MPEEKVIVKPSGSKISGHVYSKSGTIIHGAKVRCNEQITHTLADGYYFFNDLGPSIFELSVTIQGFQPETKTVAIKVNEHVTLDFYLNNAVGNASIQGHVYDSETRKPIVDKGTVILILPVFNKYAHIDVDGAYIFNELEAGTYTLFASVPGYYDCKIVLTINEGESKIQDFFCRLNKDIEPAWG